MTKRMPKAFGFDVFGTVVDWRGGVIRDVSRFLSEIGRTDVEADVFADAWRMRYLEVMSAYARSGRGFVTLDILHREMLDATLDAFAIETNGVPEKSIVDLNRAWHRLDAWPDAPPGIARLRKKVPVVTLTNGNVAMMVALARRSGIVWDAILGAEVSGVYKPDPAAYLRTAEMLGIEPADLCLVASHHADLAAARSCGLVTAYVDRPHEFGGAPAPDAAMAQEWDWTSDSIDSLATTFGESWTQLE